MPIVNIEYYLEKTISDNLSSILSNSILVKNDILGELPSEVVDKFCTTFCTDKGNRGVPLPVVFTFPNVKENGTFILLQFKGSDEDDESGSIGMDEASYGEYAEGDTLKEKLEVSLDSQGNPYVTTSNPIVSLLSVMYLSSGYSFKNNRVNLPKIPPYTLPGSHTVTIMYNPVRELTGGNKAVYKHTSRLGINLVGTYTLDIVSSNQGILRCLTSLMQAIFIRMRSSLSENSNIILPHITFNGSDLIEEITSPTNSTSGQQLYYRRAEIAYKVTQSVDVDAGAVISKINNNGTFRYK